MEEGQNIPIRILDLEPHNPSFDERKLFDERRPPLLELGEQCVGVLRVDVGIPARPFVPSVVRAREHFRSDCLEDDADPVSAHVAIVDVVRRTLEIECEPEALDVMTPRRQVGCNLASWRLFLSLATST